MRGTLPLALLGLLIGTAQTRADLIFLKDGFVLNGKIRDEKVAVVDPVSKDVYNLRKFFVIDDGPRRFYFSPTQMQEIDNSHQRAEDAVINPRRWAIVNPKRVPPIFDVSEYGTWDEKWDRTFRFRSVMGEETVKQHMSFVNSHFAEVHCLTRYPYLSYYLTEEIGFDVVRRLLTEHPDLHDPLDLPANKRIDRRFRLYHFFVHAGWLSQAGEELARVERDFPAAKKRVEEAREKLRKMQTQRHFDAIKIAHRAGRRKWLTEQFRFFAEEHAPVKTLDEYRALKSAVETDEERMKQIIGFLEEHLKGAGPDNELFTEAVAAIKAELYPEAMGRLELYVEQAKAAANQRKTKGKSELSDAQLLSLAVSGWLLGNAAAETKVETIRKLWRGRQHALAFVRGDANEREKLAAQSPADLPSVDEMLLILATLPPAFPDEKLPKGIEEQKAKGVSYHLQLPDEYHPGRPYPVLIVLHHGIEDAKTIMGRFADRARQEGFILAAPSWQQQAGAAYGFSEEEHLTVQQTLLDLRRRFNVDSDRVFLFGHGVGATMAFDVGMSHPDLFAGVLPMCGSPEYFSRHYWSNAQYLPFYTISGDLMGPASKQVRDLFEKWVPHGYPSIHVQYKGRGQEWFGAEVGPMFEWMARKRRAAPSTNLGRYGPDGLGDEFLSYRASDNRFYWITSDSIDPKFHNKVPGWQTKFPARLQATINPNQNQVFVSMTGFRQLTLWLTRDARLDFEKPVTVRVNTAVVVNNRKVTPSIKTLLEDFAHRLDRQRLFVARIDMNVR